MDKPFIIVNGLRHYCDGMEGVSRQGPHAAIVGDVAVSGEIEWRVSLTTESATVDFCPGCGAPLPEWLADIRLPTEQVDDRG